jgi:hypothetical protein
MFYFHNNAYVRYLSLECLLLDNTVVSCIFLVLLPGKITWGPKRGEFRLVFYLSGNMQNIRKGEVRIEQCLPTYLLNRVKGSTMSVCLGGDVLEMGVSRIDN